VNRSPLIFAFALAGLTACGTTFNNNGTLAELESLQPDVDEVYLDDSLDRAAQSYRRYLAETPESARTPEAMRRLADLQLEREYGVIGGGNIVQMAAPDSASSVTPLATKDTTPDTETRGQASESDQDFEQRASTRQEVLSAGWQLDAQLPDGESSLPPAGPLEAIETYRKILETYPNYKRNDQVLYQMSRAHDELGQPDEAMALMQRLITDYPYSNYLDEVYFRRGEYFFVRKKYLDAEDSYKSIINMGQQSSYYELALYKLGWALYKQQMYEESLHVYMAMLDYRLTTGYDFEKVDEEDEDHRIVDTFRVVSLGFSNLGDAAVIDEYFDEYGHRSYADKIYSNLGEFYFAKLRYEDAAAVHKSFVKKNPLHRVSPHFSMRVIEIYEEAGFPQLVVGAKKEFATNYALTADYWSAFEVVDLSEVVALLKTNLTDLANYYHTLYQDEALVDERPASFSEAQNWYRQFLTSFPQDPDSPPINYQLADLLLENEDYNGAAIEYERTAYDYSSHEQASGAGYAAVYAYREYLKVTTDEHHKEVRQSTVRSSLKFADAFPDHEQAPVVLGAAADDLYDMREFHGAIETAHKVIARYPDTETPLLRAAWIVVAHSSIDIVSFPEAEQAYLNVLALTPPEDESRVALIESLAAAIYKQGEQAMAGEDYRGAANHFLRIKDVAPSSAIRTAAEYDAAAALINLEDWTMASGVLEDFRRENPGHELHSEATKQLAFVYREDGQIERSAAEYERIAKESNDPELSREALLTAGGLYDQIASVENVIRVYEQYVVSYPLPLDTAMETRNRLADIFKSRLDYERYFQELNEIIAIDGSAGSERTDRSRYLAARAALVLAEQKYQQFASLKLDQPFEESLAEKQQRMDMTLEAFENLVPYEVAEVTAAATFYISDTYFGFSVALLESERPADLSSAEKIDYELVIEEEAYPFEERGIEIHEDNVELLAVGVYNAWVQKSFDKLAILMPGRYAKSEISDGFVGSIDFYAYRMPIVPDPTAPEPADTDAPAEMAVPAIVQLDADHQ